MHISKKDSSVNFTAPSYKKSKSETDGSSKFRQHIRLQDLNNKN